MTLLSFLSNLLKATGLFLSYMTGLKSKEVEREDKANTLALKEANKVISKKKGKKRKMKERVPRLIFRPNWGEVV